MRQILFELPWIGVKIYGFGAMMVIALFSAVGLASWRARRVKLIPEVFYDLAFFMILGGVIGARLFYVLQHGEAIHHVSDIFKIWQGGIVLYGSIIGGAAGYLLYRWRHPFPFCPSIDVLAPSVVLGVAIGRIGCFLNGCCYGDLCELPWAVRFPAETLPWAHHISAGILHQTALRSLPVHPTQLYSTLDGLILFGLLTAYYPRRRRDGEVMALLMVTYPVTRFLIEALRDDEGAIFAGMTISQNISVLLFLGGLVFWYHLSRIPAELYADRPESAEALEPPLPLPTYSLPQGP